MSRQALKAAIKTAFQSQKMATNEDAAIENISNQIAVAVSVYVISELEALSIILKAPGAYMVTLAPAGVAPTAPAVINSYTPGIP